VVWWSGGVVRREGGQYRVAKADRLFRPLFVYSAGRTVPIDVRGSRVASTVAAYHSAVRRYIEANDPDALNRFRGVFVGGVELETDLDVLDAMAHRGEFDLESIYREVA
jgi:hypothetical protein